MAAVKATHGTSGTSHGPQCFQGQLKATSELTKVSLHALNTMHFHKALPFLTNHLSLKCKSVHRLMSCLVLSDLKHISPIIESSHCFGQNYI